MCAYVDFEMTTRFLNSKGSLFEAEVSAMVIVKNGASSGFVLSNFVFSSNTTTGLEGSTVVTNTKFLIKYLFKIY